MRLSCTFAARAMRLASTTLISPNAMPKDVIAMQVISGASRLIARIVFTMFSVLARAPVSASGSPIFSNESARARSVASIPAKGPSPARTEGRQMRQ